MRRRNGKLLNLIKKHSGTNQANNEIYSKCINENQNPWKKGRKNRDPILNCKSNVDEIVNRFYIHQKGKEIARHREKKCRSNARGIARELAHLDQTIIWFEKKTFKNCTYLECWIKYDNFTGWLQPWFAIYLNRHIDVRVDFDVSTLCEWPKDACD